MAKKKADKVDIKLLKGNIKITQGENTINTDIVKFVKKLDTIREDRIKELEEELNILKKKETPAKVETVVADIPIVVDREPQKEGHCGSCTNPLKGGSAICLACKRTVHKTCIEDTVCKACLDQA